MQKISSRIRHIALHQGIAALHVHFPELSNFSWWSTWFISSNMWKRQISKLYIFWKAVYLLPRDSSGLPIELGRRLLKLGLEYNLSAKIWAQPNYISHLIVKSLAPIFNTTALGWAGLAHFHYLFFFFFLSVIKEYLRTCWESIRFKSPNFKTVNRLLAFHCVD